MPECALSPDIPLLLVHVNHVFYVVGVVHERYVETNGDILVVSWRRRKLAAQVSRYAVLLVA